MYQELWALMQKWNAECDAQPTEPRSSETAQATATQVCAGTGGNELHWDWILYVNGNFLLEPVNVPLVDGYVGGYWDDAEDVLLGSGIQGGHAEGELGEVIKRISGEGDLVAIINFLRVPWPAALSTVTPICPSDPLDLSPGATFDFVGGFSLPEVDYGIISRGSLCSPLPC
jgi:hypothetical protein